MKQEAVPELIYDNIESDEEVDNIDVPVLPVTIDSPKTIGTKLQKNKKYT